METFLLVEKAPVLLADGTDHWRILETIRTYSSGSRAHEDADLLKKLTPERCFQVIPVDHIDD